MLLIIPFTMHIKRGRIQLKVEVNVYIIHTSLMNISEGFHPDYLKTCSSFAQLFTTKSELQ